MIDTNELRRLAQAATHPVTKRRWIRLFGERTVYDRTEDGCRGIPVVSTDKPPSLFEAVCLDFIAAANPAAINELLDRLEAAEKDNALKEKLIDRLALELNSTPLKHDALRAKLEAVEKEREELRTKISDLMINVAFLDNLKKSYEELIEELQDERDALRAKIAEMERQEPVAEWTENRFHHYPQLDWAAGYKAVIGAKLYALPGAKGEEK